MLVQVRFRSGRARNRIERRTQRKRGGGKLSGYAVDVTIRVNGEEAYFLQDHNSTRSAMPHNDRQELIDTLLHDSNAITGITSGTRSCRAGPRQP